MQTCFCTLWADEIVSEIKSKHKFLKKDKFLLTQMQITIRPHEHACAFIRGCLQGVRGKYTLFGK